MRIFKVFSIFIMLLLILFMPMIQGLDFKTGHQPIFSIDHQASMECPSGISEMRMVEFTADEKENLNAILVNTEMIDQNTQANLDTEKEISVNISEARADYLIRFS